MVILDQEENRIILLETVLFIHKDMNYRNLSDMNCYIYAIFDTNSQKGLPIGKYATEERAKEVIKEIFEAAGRLQKSYIMPKE